MEIIKFTYLKLILISFLILTSFTFYNCSGYTPEFSNNRTKLNSQLQTMINVLNGAHYSQFIQEYVDPGYISKAGGLDQVVLSFNNEKQRQIFAALKAAQNIDPVSNSKGTVMTYSGGALPVAVMFRQVNNKWYLTGDWLEYN
ncbi:MAG TPA: hypothetical protein PK294_03345 [Ignavibacteria bacterium]|nr:hypothetical protein [Ignavibacteria bacterium]HQY52958.1 hypothetical protein [Ignavibacteria bacterium]HRA99452.1 hypothetical protein [Ignavibacteria bacterium]